MGRTALLKRNERRVSRVVFYADKRAALLVKLRDKKLSYEDRLLVYDKIRSLPRDSSPNRVRNICAVTSRARATYRDFGVSRIVLRKYALQGMIPGLFKGSL